MREYARSLLDIYNQLIHDILNGIYDSTEDIPGTYSEAWEQAISEAWDNVEQSTEAVPGEKDKPTDGDEDEKDDPEGGGGATATPTMIRKNHRRVGMKTMITLETLI